MATGSVKWFDESKGLGTLTWDFGENVFVHRRAIARGGFQTLAERRHRESDPRRGPSGAWAARAPGLA